jgi:hypothetical protein
VPEPIEIAFFEHPVGCGRARSAIGYAEQLIQHLRVECDVHVSLSLVDGRVALPRYASILEAFLADCQKLGLRLDIYWVHSLLHVARDPRQLTVPLMKGLSELKGFDFATIEPWLAALLREPCEKPAPNQFIGIEGDRPPRNLAQGGRWGAEVPPYDGLATAIERRGAAESVYHALLHLLCVDEGYDDLRKPLAGCEACWMQYDPTLGSGLCARHVSELKAFLATRAP